MNLEKILGLFSQSLQPMYYKNHVLIVDMTRLHDPEYEYGIWAVIEDPGKPDMTGWYCIPDFYLEGNTDFYLNDDLKNHFGYGDESIKKIEECANLNGFYSEEVLNLLKTEKSRISAYDSLKAEIDALEASVTIPENYRELYAEYKLPRVNGAEVISDALWDVIDSEICSVIDLCAEMNPLETAVFEGFGLHGEFVLHIHKDPDYVVGTDRYNIVTIAVTEDGIPVHDTADVHVIDLYGELLRIWNHDRLELID